jgi:nitroreductase
MDALEAIWTRRSIRKYQAKPVPEELIRKILAAGMMAPIARDARPWQFIVIDDPKLLAEIPKSCPNAPMAARAPAAILVCGDLGLEKSEGYWVIDCAAATENMLLAAHALGLGAVWCGVHPREPRVAGLRRLLGVPEGVNPHSLVVLGYPAEERESEDRYRADRVRRNGWK